jgi:hypothetical protein
MPTPAQAQAIARYSSTGGVREISMRSTTAAPEEWATWDTHGFLAQIDVTLP